MPRALLALAVLALAAGPAHAHDGPEHEPAKPVKRITLKAYAKRANAVCNAAAAKIAALSVPAGPEGYEDFFRAALAIAEPADAKLEAIPLPRTKARTAQRVVASELRETALARAFVDRLATGADPAAEFAAFDKATAPLEAEQDKAWKALGAKACAD